MPQRFLRPGITTSEPWNAVSFEAQSLYIRILTLVDDFGRYDGRIPILHGQCFALRSDIKQQRTAALRSELHESGLITVYAVEGKEFIQVMKWQERARVAVSKYPDPDDPGKPRCVPLRSAASIASISSPLHPISSPLPNGADKPRGIVEGNGSDLLPSTPQSQRMAKLFNRRLTTTWSEAEVRAYKKLGTISDDDLSSIERYYGSERAKGDEGIHRRDLATFLNNFSGELDRSKNGSQKADPLAGMKRV